jgi:hypothetical protein
MKAAPPSAFVMAQANLLLEVLVVPFDPPAPLGVINEFDDRCVVNKRRTWTLPDCARKTLILSPKLANRRDPGSALIHRLTR